MRTTTRRFATIVAGALLAAQTLGGVALATPADPSLPLIPNELFQNGCTRDRQERAQAEAEGREPEDIEEVNQPAWRRVFSGANRHGPTPHNLCIFGDRFSGSEVDIRGR
jgi:hypothetical protein